MTTETLLALAINRISALRANEKTTLAEVVDTVSLYEAMDQRMIGQIIGRSLRPLAISTLDTLKAAERDFTFCMQRNIAIIPVWDQRYPPPLREIFDPPFMVFVRGTLPDPERPGVAVVGTRDPSAKAVVAAEKLGESLAAAGYCVVSGLARGIDAASHRGAVGHGPTGAVLGCGIDRVYPAGHRTLASRMLQSGGFLMSEYSPGVGSAKYHFPARNRIISGLSRGVVIVQAPARSGALITAEYALDQGRDLFVHSAGLHGTAGAGTRELAEDGARIISGAEDVFDEWGIESQPASAGEQRDGASSPVTSGTEAGRQLADEIRGLLRSGSSDG